MLTRWSAPRGVRRCGPPPSDAAFVAFAKLTVDDAVTTTDELERRLRARYPRAVVHARRLADEPVVVWHVYRDGRWVPLERVA